MKFTLSWLKEHLDTTASVAEIVERLTSLGLEVEGCDNPSDKVRGFIVGHLLEAEKHPGADRLRVCKVDTGKGILQVVCGAPNARAGLKVILAQPGVVIPVTGEPLKKGMVRGVESQGMMCSWRELSLGEDHEGIAELPEGTPLGSPLAEVIPFEITIEVSITPNRADCLGVRGIARDLAAAGLGQLKPLPVPTLVSAFKSPIGVRLAFGAIQPSPCPLFVGRVIRGVKNGPSPQWLKDRLTAIGLRPISALVDITNYMTYDLGRPLHVFDAATVKGDIQVRLAQVGETLPALNGKTYPLDETMTVIADESGPEGLGGVMGGEASGCSDSTTSVFLEVAYFDPIRTATTGRKLEILSDARFRFERGVDPAFLFDAAAIATQMILDLCGGEASEVISAGAEPAWRRSISFRPARVASLGGVEVDTGRQETILRALGCDVAAHGATLSVQPPSWRADLVNEADLVEEILRIHGYDRLPAVSLPRPAMPVPVLTPSQRVTGWVRRELATRGLVEAVTWSFLSSDTAKLFGADQPGLRLANPISSDLDVMRPSVLPNLLLAVGRNSDRGSKDPALFEIGPQFDSPSQQRSVAAGVRAGRAVPRHWTEKTRHVDAFDAKADALAALQAAGVNTESLQISATTPGWYHPGRSGALTLGQKTVALFGEIHPGLLSALDLKSPVVGFEVFLDTLPLRKAKPGKARPPLKASAFQAVERDFAFILEASVPAASVLRATRNADKVHIVSAEVFDLYHGGGEEGKKSMAVSVTLQPGGKTFTDEEIEEIARKVVTEVEKGTGGVLRR